MPKYEVTVKDIEIYVIDCIEAENFRDAEDRALRLLKTEEGKEKYHNDSDDDIEAIELDE